MDLAVFDVSAVDPAVARPGGFVELLGDDYGVDDAAADAGTIGYEILTALGRALSSRLSRRAACRPYAGVLASIGAAFLGFLAATGRLVIFALTALATAFSPPFYPRLILRQIVDIGYYSLPVVGLTAIFTGMVLALQSYTGFSRFAAESAVATVVVLSVTRELGPVIAGLMVAGRIGAAMAAEIGTMRVTDQIDALTTLSTDPLRYLVVPRLLAGLVTLPLLVLVADIIGVFGGYLVGIYKLGFNPAAYLAQHRAVSGDERCRLRPHQGRRVRLHRRADGLLSRLPLARRRAGRGRGDDLCRGVGLDPDPGVRLPPHPGAVRAMSGPAGAPTPKIAVRGLHKIVRPQARARRHRYRCAPSARASSSSAARAPASR